MLEQLVKILLGGNISAFVVGIAIVLFHKVNNITDYFENKKNRPIKNSKEAYDSLDDGDTLLKEFFKEQVSYQLFKRLTKISTTKPIREELVKLHNSSEGRISMYQLERAWNASLIQFDYDKRRLKAEPSRLNSIFDKLFISIGLFFLCAFVFFLALMFIAFISHEEITVILGYGVGSLSFSFGSFFFAYLSMPYKSIIAINNELKRQELLKDTTYHKAENR